MGEKTFRTICLELLQRIDGDSGYSHLLIDREIKRHQLTNKDAALLTEIVYGTMERKMTLDYMLEPFIHHKKLESWVHMLLRMSVYQMIYLDKVPDYAIINDAVEIGKKSGHKGIASFVNGVLRNVRRKGVRDPQDISDPIQRLSISTSHPKWLIKRWVAQYGMHITEKMAQTNLKRKPLSVRVQPLKISRDDAMAKLKQLGFSVSPSTFSKQGIVVEKGNVLQTDLFLEGFMTIQDQTSMLVAEMLQVQPGMTVLDACSAPGGKVTHVAELMDNTGVVHAYDLHKKKVRLLRERMEKIDLKIIDVYQGDARKLQSRHDPSSYDRIIVDAPCSGFGVIRGKPDIKYRKNEADIRQLAHIQYDILNHVASLLIEDGKLIYSTCTVEKDENEHVVRRFIETHPEFTVDTSFFKDIPTFLHDSEGLSDLGLQIFPQTFNTDGFFLTRLIKQL